MIGTRLCDLLGIDYPLIQGGMNVISNAELAAAVSHAGGLGVVTPYAGLREPAPSDGLLLENLRDQIRRVRSLTPRPFGVNFSLNFGGRGTVAGRPFIDLALEEKVPVVITSAGSPESYTQYLKRAGVRVLHVVASVRHARKTEEAGVDAVVAEGYEAGGHNGVDEIPTLVLVPQVADAVGIPVVAAGGIADARGLVAALALGAEGVQIGTAFVATHECVAHPKFKEAVVGATDAGTIVVGKRISTTRRLRNNLTTILQTMESAGASAEEMMTFLGPGRVRRGQLEGDLEEGEALCGAVAGLIREITSAQEVVWRVVEGAPEVLARLR